MTAITTPTQIGGIIAARRKALQLSQQGLAVQVGISQNRLSELEAHPEKLTLDRALALLNVLGLELAVRQRPAAAARRVEW
ncbi:MAG: helix-turn-helix domain-containing protein [Gammaproteobacteria bacterium]